MTLKTLLVVWRIDQAGNYSCRRESQNTMAQETFEKEKVNFTRGSNCVKSI